jgi:hypothetical protein
MWMSTKRGRQTIGALIAAAGVIVVVMAFVAAPPRAQSGWTVVDARVSVIVQGTEDRACLASNERAPVFDYRTPRGTFSEVGSTWCNVGASIDTWQVGDIGRVAYDPADPATAVVVGDGAPPYPYGFILLGAMLVALGAWVSWTARRMPSAHADPDR